MAPRPWWWCCELMAVSEPSRSTVSLLSWSLLVRKKANRDKMFPDVDLLCPSRSLLGGFELSFPSFSWVLSSSSILGNGVGLSEDSREPRFDPFMADSLRICATYCASQGSRLVVWASSDRESETAGDLQYSSLVALVLLSTVACASNMVTWSRSPCCHLMSFVSFQLNFNTYEFPQVATFSIYCRDPTLTRQERIWGSSTRGHSSSVGASLKHAQLLGDRAKDSAGIPHSFLAGLEHCFHVNVGCGVQACLDKSRCDLVLTMCAPCSTDNAA